MYCAFFFETQSGDMETQYIYQQTINILILLPPAFGGKNLSGIMTLVSLKEKYTQCHLKVKMKDLTI